MASTSTMDLSLPAIFTTHTPYPLPAQKFMVPASWRRYQLSQLVNRALGLARPVPFDFLLRGALLPGSLGEWCAAHGAGEEETLEIEYVESVLPAQRVSALPHEDWVAGVSARVPRTLLTASYDGHLRAFDYSQTQQLAAPVHSAAVTSLAVIPTPSSTDESTVFVATASHDLTGALTRLTLPTADRPNAAFHTSATLHLHTGPLASISSSLSGAHLLTAGWDGLIGLWDTAVPTTDEVPDEPTPGERRKRRRVADGEARAKRKAPLGVLKSHTARVSKAVFTPAGEEGAVSCGLDATVRAWDVESGVCTHTITSSEKPMLDLALDGAGTTAYTASTDRTVTLFDLRTDGRSSSSAISALPHPATPSCVVAAPGNTHQVASGAYDGVVRVWDGRSARAPVASFRADAGGRKKVLGLDWCAGVIAVGGEGGLEVWKVGEGGARA